MKKTINLLVIVFAFMYASCSSSSTENAKSNSSDSTKIQTLDTTKFSKGTVFYQCEMDPEVMSDKPGTCSKCGMDLEKVEKK